jgi:beta-N-acetylhexosaminidase
VNTATTAGVASRPHALLSIDQEGGIVKRVPDIAPTRSAPQLGATDRVAITRAQGLATARALVSLGIPFDLAPVADLDLGPRHVMRARSFGSSPAKVARHVAAFATGLRAGGGATAVKHFPGFGGASVNSDDALAHVTRTRAQLVADLLPFRSAVAAGADAIMISHGVYTAIDRRHPASTSPAIYRLLRQDLGFDGVAITDSLHADGFRAATHVSIPEGCVRAIAAGADIALLTGPLRDAVACRASIVAAVHSGRITRARLDQAATRVLRLKSRLGLLPAG